MLCGEVIDAAEAGSESEVAAVVPVIDIEVAGPAGDGRCGDGDDWTPVTIPARKGIGER